MKYPTFDEVQQLRDILREQAHLYWLHETFMTWQWFLLIGLAIIPWFIWWKIVDKNRVHEILLYGLLIALMAIILDSIGSNAVWWGYPNEIYAVVPPLVPADLTIVPGLMMLVYQFYTKWKIFIVANVVFALLATFIGETILEWIGYFERGEWKYIYSIMFYIFSAIIAKFIVKKTSPI